MRRKLREYLNDPKLLHTISVEDLKEWAREVPYAGLVHKLLVQKLILAKAPEEELQKATTLAILNNANPGLVLNSIEDFKKMMLTTSLEEMVEEQVDDAEGAHGVSDTEKELTKEESSEETLESAALIDESLSYTSMEVVEDSLLEDQSSVEEDALEELSNFTSWLISLKPVEKKKKEPGEGIELRDKELSSSALAELLVQQGHYKRAIAMYELLMLKNPQKSSFFAAQIEKLKSL